MKLSIKKIFKNLQIFLLIILALSTFSILFIAEQFYSYEKVNILNEQKAIIANITAKQQESNKIDIYIYNGTIANINHAVKKLQTQSEYYYLSTYLLDTTSEYMQDLKSLESLIQAFDKQSRSFYAIDKTTKIQKKNLQNISMQIGSNIDLLILKNVRYDQERFSLLSKIVLLIFLLLLTTTIIYKRRLSQIYSDIASMYSINSKNNTLFFTQEADSILLKFNRKTQITDNPSCIDPVTEIYNNKGMLQAYAERKSTKDTGFSSVTVLEIDNFSKSKRSFSQEFTQTILKKVAYAVSLHQQSTDIIARSDYNQFTLIFSRSSKQQLLKHTELVRQSIEEIKLITPEKETIQVTVTGGFIYKDDKTALEETIKRAKELLRSAKDLGTNKIIQTKDIPK